MRNSVLIVLLALLSVPVTAREVTTEQVEEAFREALIQQGFVPGGKCHQVIKEMSEEISSNMNDLNGLTLHVDESEGQREGLCYAVFPDGQIQRVGYYSGGKPVGAWFYYYRDGALQARNYYDSSGREQGQWTFYWRNGNVNYVEYYESGLKEGAKTTYYSSGRVHIHQQWAKGRMHGISIIYYESGALKKISKFDNGAQHGVATLYNPDGTIAEQVEYEHGRRR